MYHIKPTDPDTLAKIVRQAVKTLKGVKFDTIVFRGFSGAIIGPIVALQLKKPWALVRKRDDQSHSSRYIEGTVKGDYIIIDDVIEGGGTIRTIVRECSDSKCVGVYLYDSVWIEQFSINKIYAEYKECIGGIKMLNWES